MSDEKSLNFIEEIISQDLASGKHKSILTRFPPEPNGYLHIGHAKSICLNFGLAETFGGATNLRFDDTNPVTEDTEYVESIKADLKWLGFNWIKECYASDYFDQLYAFAVQLIEKGLAYVDDSSAEAIAQQKGTPTQPGTGNAFRERSIQENLTLFAEMKAGKYNDGEKVLRAKIDFASSNMHMRDPIIYRIKHAHHHRTGNKWCIYPMYDFAHPLEDALEHITHSLCTLEFENHRPLYAWFIENCPVPSKPRQIEFARLNLTYTVMSKRKLLQLVQEGHVDGWDDPRLPTISGMRRRGYPAAAIRDFCKRIGITKFNGTTDVALLEFDIRYFLNHAAPRRMMCCRFSCFGWSSPAAARISASDFTVSSWKRATRCDLSPTSSARWRIGSCVATPVGQAPVWQCWAWMQPSANMKPRAALHQSAPSAMTRAISKAEVILPEAPSLTRSRSPTPMRALWAKDSPSRKGMPT